MKMRKEDVPSDTCLVDEFPDSLEYVCATYPGVVDLVTGGAKDGSDFTSLIKDALFVLLNDARFLECLASDYFRSDVTSTFKCLVDGFIEKDFSRFGEWLDVKYRVHFSIASAYFGPKLRKVLDEFSTRLR